jgi:hypothetical protein
VSGLHHRLRGTSNPGAAGVEYLGGVSTQNSSLSLSSLGLQSGDIVIVVSGIDNENGSVSIPSGWTRIQAMSEEFLDGEFFYKIMGATPDTSVSAANNETGVTIAAAFRNISGGLESAADLGSVDPPSLTIDAAGNLVVIVGLANDYENDFSAPTSAPSSFEFVAGISSGSGAGTVHAAMGYKVALAPGTENPGAWSNMRESDSSGEAAAIVEFEPN